MAVSLILRLLFIYLLLLETLPVRLVSHPCRRFGALGVELPFACIGGDSRLEQKALPWLPHECRNLSRAPSSRSCHAANGPSTCGRLRRLGNARK